MAEKKKAKEEAGASPARGEAASRGLAAAARYLELIGYEVLERKWSCPAGEIDLIARDVDTVVFIEVEVSTSLSRGLPSEETGEERRSRLEKIAAWYLMGYEYVDVPVRFDVVALLVVADDRALTRHYCNALCCG